MTDRTDAMHPSPALREHEGDTATPAEEVKERR